jgi:hypothetical protein
MTTFRAMSSRVGLLALLGVLLAGCGGITEKTEPTAAQAPAKLVFVKSKNSYAGSVYVASADGSSPKRLARGAFPAISPDGEWVAYATPALAELRLIPSGGGTFVQTTIDTRDLRDIKFSPDSRYVGVAGRDRLWINEVETGKTVRTGRGAIQGWSFSPDSKQVIYSRARLGDDYPAPAAIYKFDIKAKRSTRFDSGLNPLWTANGIVYDVFGDLTGGEALPRYELVKDKQALAPAPERDDLTSGLVPIAASADGTRVLTALEGQSRNTPYAVENGQARDLGDNDGFVPTGLSRDGAAVLGFTGLADPGNPHAVMELPWGGGPPKLLVRNASWARWNR